MVMNPNSAAVVINASRVQKQYRQKVDIPTISGTTYLGNTSSSDLSRAWPIDYLLVKFTGVLTVSVGTMDDLHPFGAMNLIKKFTVKANGKDAIFDCPGYLLQYVSDLFTHHPSYGSNPAKTVGANAFAYYFRIPLNPGPGMLGLFDPTALRSLTLEIQWGTAADIASGTGTATVTTANLDVGVAHVAGLDPKVLGGRGYGYPLHIIETQTYTLNGSNSAFPVDLQRGDPYWRLCILALNNNASTYDQPSDAILNSATSRFEQSRWRKDDALTLQYDALSRYGWTSKRTGWYVVDNTEDRRLVAQDPNDLMMVSSAALPFQLELDVNAPAGTNKLIIIHDRWTSGSN